MIGTIFSKLNESLFWELLWNDFGVRELAEKRNLSPAKISLFFSFLIKNDLAKSVFRKNQKIVSLNRENALVRELISLAIINKIINASCFNGIKKTTKAFLLFGSGASGLVDKMSDIDLCIISEKKFSLLESSNIKHCFSKELNKEVNIKFYTTNEFRQLQKTDKVFYSELNQKSKLIFGEIIE